MGFWVFLKGSLSLGDVLIFSLFRGVLLRIFLSNVSLFKGAKRFCEEMPSGTYGQVCLLNCFGKDHLFVSLTSFVISI